MEGLQVLDPTRLLMLFAAHRHLQRDIVNHFGSVCRPSRWRLAANPVRSPGWLRRRRRPSRGVNRIADYDTVLFYGDPGLPDLPPAAKEGTEVMVADPDGC